MTYTPLHPSHRSLVTSTARRKDQNQAQSLPRLIGLGCATPAFKATQSDIAATLADTWQLAGRERQRWLGISHKTGIHTRHGVVEFDRTIDMTTAERMHLYEEHAPDLAARAAMLAMDDADISAERITDLIVVSCTGFSAPGLDVALINRLGLKPTVRRTMIGFMGCFGAISGLRCAGGACAADPQGTALVVCVELCSLHARRDTGVDNQIATALFSDGAAAAIVTASDPPTQGNAHTTRSMGHLTTGYSRLLPEGRDWMTWRVTDSGFTMTLSRKVPHALQMNIADFVRHASSRSVESFVVHPGGPGILDAVDAGLGLEGGCGLEASRAILREYGNMSSATVLFVLQRALHHTRPMMLLAFGPGLTIESILVT